MKLYLPLALFEGDAFCAFRVLPVKTLALTGNTACTAFKTIFKVYNKLLGFFVPFVYLSRANINTAFCDTKLMAPRHWDEVLTWIYGDYKKLPPKNKRVPGHSTAQIQVFDEEETCTELRK